MADFDQVLSLTSESFDKAHFMKARIFVKEGRWAEARESLKTYQSKVPKDKSAMDFLLDVSDAEAAAKKAAQAQKAKLWTACQEAATEALKMASYSPSIRQQRANCELGGGEYEQAISDLT